MIRSMYTQKIVEVLNDKAVKYAIDRHIIFYTNHLEISWSKKAFSPGLIQFLYWLEKICRDKYGFELEEYKVTINSINDVKTFLKEITVE